MSTKPKIDPYNIKFHGEVLDPYRVADLFSIKDPIVFQMLKKILRFGRKHKSQKQYVIDTITSAIRWLEIHSPADAERFKTKEVIQPTKIKILRDDSVPAFGAWCAGSLKENDPTILLNLEVCFGEIVTENGQTIQQTPDDKKRVVIETILHEFGHTLEEFFNLEFNETEIERICTTYQPSN